MVSQLTRGPVTSGGCRETVSVTSSCTHPLPLPGGLGTQVRPYFARWGQQAHAAWPLRRRLAAESLAEPSNHSWQV